MGELKQRASIKIQSVWRLKVGQRRALQRKNEKEAQESARREAEFKLRHEKAELRRLEESLLDMEVLRDLRSKEFADIQRQLHLHDEQLEGRKGSPSHERARATMLRIKHTGLQPYAGVAPMDTMTDHAWWRRHRAGTELSTVLSELQAPRYAVSVGARSSQDEMASVRCGGVAL